MSQQQENVTSTEQLIETGPALPEPENVQADQQPSSVSPAAQPANVPSTSQPENPLPGTDNLLQQPVIVNNEPESSEEKENGIEKEKEENGIQKEEHGIENEKDEQQTPKINCPEKIVLCFDLSSELNETILRHTRTFTVFEQLKKAMAFFVKYKLKFNRKHQIAILTFEKEALWVQDFSSDVSLIIDTLDNLHANPNDPLPQFDMMSLLQAIESHVELPESSNLLDVPPDYLVRVVLIYGRSHSEIPTLSPEAKQIFDQYISCRQFFLDVLYIHALPEENNKCEEIYEALCKLDETEDCFVLEASTAVAARLHECTAKLLAHPLQRPKQQDIEYSIAKRESSDEETRPE